MFVNSKLKTYRMKKYFTLIMLSVCLFAACSDDEATLDKGNTTAQITAEINFPTTRAIGYNWNGDHIGVMVSNSSNSNMADRYKNVEYVAGSTEFRADFNAVGDGIMFEESSDIVTFSAYAPYQTSKADDVLPGTNGMVEVNTMYNNTAQTQESIDFLFASGAVASKEDPRVYFISSTGSGSDCSFHHKMSRLQLKFIMDIQDFLPEEVFQLKNINLGGLKHEGTFDVMTGRTHLNEDAESVSDWDISDCKYTDYAEARVYSLVLLPESSNDGLSLSVVLNGKTYVSHSTLTPKLESGKSCTYTIAVTKNGLSVTGGTVSEWEDEEINEPYNYGSAMVKVIYDGLSYSFKTMAGEVIQPTFESINNLVANGFRLDKLIGKIGNIAYRWEPGSLITSDDGVISNVELYSIESLDSPAVIVDVDGAPNDSIADAAIIGLTYNASGYEYSPFFFDSTSLILPVTYYMERTVHFVTLVYNPNQTVSDGRIRLSLRHNKNKDTELCSYTSYDFAVGTGYLNFFYKAYDLKDIFDKYCAMNGTSEYPTTIEIEYKANPYLYELDDDMTETKVYTIENK